jgi:hypothetical protein
MIRYDTIRYISLLLHDNAMENSTAPKMSLVEINERINREMSRELLKELSDESLLSEYQNCVSVKKNIKCLETILEKYIDKETEQKIVAEYLLHLIPAGTKGVIRGNKFNNIIMNYIVKMALNPDIFEICFERKCEQYFTTEIPDWYILEKQTNKILIGMNQIDLWSGGQQLNRGSKYIENNKHNTENSRLLCVVCNNIQFKSNKNKAYRLFEIGFENNTLCFIGNLQNIINLYFNVV